MTIQQVSVFLENKVGQLSEIATVLAQGEINIRSLSLADTRDFGVLRLIVDQPDKAAALLRNKGAALRITEVIAVAVPDKAGALADVMNALGAKGINVKYMYAFAGRTQAGAVLIIRFDDTEKAIRLIEEEGLNCVSDLQ